MCTFQALFEAYGGDYRATMDRFMGKHDFYLKLLDMLLEDENLARLGAAIEAGDASQAFAAAHTLKGAAGNMGLTPLYRAVCAITEPLRAGGEAEYRALYMDVKEEMRKVAKLCEALRDATA